MKYSITIIILMLLLNLMGFYQEAIAQINPIGATYYQNQYLANPAIAGIDKRLVININYRQQWSSVPGAPETQSMTAEYGSNRVGLGLNIYNDVSGLLRRTRVTGSYSYHLPLNNIGKRLSFGISLGFMGQRIENSEVKGETGDMAIGRYNYNTSYLDADFGIVYTDSKLTIQGALPNMKDFLHKDEGKTVDRSTFFSAISYRLYYPDLLQGLIITPKICYRGIKGLSNMADIGSDFGFSENAINAMIMYHTNQSATFGIGMNHRKSWGINGMYTTSTTALSSYTSGSFEIGLRVNL